MKYTDSHEWICLQDTRARVGISAHGQKELGEIVYVELPKKGQIVSVGVEIAVLESTKAAVDIYSPLSGKVTKVNEALNQDISLLNEAPESEGWLFEIEIEDSAELDQLLDEESYQLLIC